MALLYPFFIKPARKVLDAKSWPATPCTIVSSTVGTHSGSKDTTYSVDITFEYTVGGATYTSRTYGFMRGSSSGYAAKQAIVSRYPPGAHTTCYVNPSEPQEAVIERGFTLEFLFGLIPLAFVGIGLLVLFNLPGSGPPPGAQSPNSHPVESP